MSLFFLAMTELGSPVLWPAGDTHTVEYAELSPNVPAELVPLVPKLRRLAQLGDAMGSLQAADGSTADEEAARGIAAASAKLLNEIAAAEEISPETAETIRLRADALTNGTSRESVARREAALGDPQPLTVICGPMGTWRPKTRTPLHSVVAATRHEGGDRLIAETDAKSKTALAAVGEKLGLEGLDVKGVYPMQVCDLIACGGEANTFPKHFAYFLPEDEDVDDPDAEKKTILFRNAYALRHEKISRRLGEAMLVGPRPSEDVDPAEVLVMWLRGHDIAHAVTLPGDGRAGAEDLEEPEAFYALAEVIADTYGGLMSMTPEWLEAAGATREDVAAIVMAEMLHYVRRGPWLWGDAGAAFIELSFLEQGGYVTVDEEARIHFDTEGVVAGLEALAKALATEVIAAPDAATVERFLEQHSWEREGGAKRVLEALRGGAVGDVPTALAYA
jgi:hypothetical protein